MKKVIKFFAPWCGPCNMYAPTFTRVAKKFEGQIDTLEVNVDQDIDGLSSTYKVRNIPFTVLIKEDGSIVSKSGNLTENELEELFLS